MYYLAINGQRTGPYEAQDVQQMLRQGAIGDETLFWKDGMLDWETVGSKGYLFETTYQQPQQPQMYQQPVYQQPPVQYQQQPILVQPVLINPAKSRVTFILLGLFLGGLGIHNFYAGYSSKGVTQLLLNLFLFWTIIVPVAVGIWVIIEVCTIDHDVYGNRML
jgi:TM2 domain-containing membrane protein YozV